MQKGFTLLSFPRQGTDFLMGCVAPGHRYSREYFNSCCSASVPWFGCERNAGGIFVRPTETEFDSVFSGWSRKYAMNKEVFSFVKADLFASRSCVAYLFRDREHTFPSSLPGLIVPIFDAFVSHDFGRDTVWGEASRYVSLMGVGDLRVKQVLIHELMWRLQLWSCPAPLLRYSELMESDRSGLESVLGSCLPDWVDSKAVAARVSKARKWDRDVREARWAAFMKGSTVARDLEKLCGFLDSLLSGSSQKIRVRVRRRS